MSYVLAFRYWLSILSPEEPESFDLLLPSVSLEGGRDELLEFWLSCSSMWANRSLNNVTNALTLAGVASQSALGISIPAISIDSLIREILNDAASSNPYFFVKPWNSY